MRGKTNATNGVHLNATAVNKTVKSGQITAGDFVEYYSDTPYIEQSSDIDFKFPFGDYSIACTGSVITAFKGGEAVDSFVDYNCTYIGKDNDDSFIVFHDNSLGILGVLTLENDEFELIDTLQTSDTVDAMTYITVGGGKVCYAKRNYTSSSADYIDIGVANISAAGELSDFNLTSITNESTHRLGSDVFGFMAYYSGFYFVFMQNGGGYSAPIEIDSNNTASISTYTSINGSYAASIRLIYKKNNVVALAIRGNGNAGYLWILNYVTANIIEKTMPDAGEIYSFINEGKFLASGNGTFGIRYSNGSFSQDIAYKLKLYGFNENTYEIFLIDEIVLSDDYSSYPQNWPFKCFSQSIDKNVAGIDNDTIYAQIKGLITGTYNSGGWKLRITWSKNLYLYEIINGGFQELTDHNFVRPYQSGHPIGVAKTDGVTNDVIPVYIPTYTP